MQTQVIFHALNQFFMPNKVQKNNKGEYVLTQTDNSGINDRSSYSVIVGEIKPLSEKELANEFDSLPENEKIEAYKFALERHRGYASSNVHCEEDGVDYCDIVKIKNVPDSLE